MWLPRRASGRAWAAVAAILLLLGLVYPYAGSYARTGGFANAPDARTACKWLEAGSPGDPGAIDWLRENAAGDAVVLEAFGDDYSAFGHAPHLDLQRPPDGDGLGRARGPVAARPRLARRRHPDALHHDGRRRPRAR